jgi:phenylacetate-CoA ligase
VRKNREFPSHEQGTGSRYQGIIRKNIRIAYTDAPQGPRARAAKTWKRVARRRGAATYGQRRTPVYTHLERTSQPMIRLASGDLTLWVDEPNPCGRTYPRLPHGIFGRIDDMFTIRGENIYPSEIDATLNALAGYGGEHQIIITREAAMDELLLRVEYDAKAAAGGAASVEQFHLEVARRIQTVLGIRAAAEIVAKGTLPRTDFKARRVIDDRAVFRDMRNQVEGKLAP